MAGLSIDDVDQAQIYDCYTFTVVITLEDYGFCPRERGAISWPAEPSVRGGVAAADQHRRRAAQRLLPLGRHPALRSGHTGPRSGRHRQEARNSVIMVSGNGGILDHHGTLILSPHRRP